MGDLSAEPSMEEILSSIKRIIAEEGEGNRPPARRAARPSVQISPVDTDEVLELSEPIPDRTPERTVAAAPPRAFAPPPAPRPADPIVSQQAAAATLGSLDALTRLVVKPDSPQADNTLEGLVRELLRPMLSDWLDARLPAIVEAMVAREIERITGSR